MKTLTILLTMFAAFSCSNNFPLKQRPSPDMGKIQDGNTIIHYLTGIEVADTVSMSLSCDIVDRNIGMVTLTLIFCDSTTGQDYLFLDGDIDDRIDGSELRLPVHKISAKEFVTEMIWERGGYEKLIRNDRFTIQFQDAHANRIIDIGIVNSESMSLLKEFAYRVEQDAL